MENTVMLIYFLFLLIQWSVFSLILCALLSNYYFSLYIFNNEDQQITYIFG